MYLAYDKLTHVPLPLTPSDRSSSARGSSHSTTSWSSEHFKLIPLRLSGFRVLEDRLKESATVTKMVTPSTSLGGNGDRDAYAPGQTPGSFHGHAVCKDEECPSRVYLEMLERTLQSVIKERDEARAVIEDIRGLMDV